MPTPRLDSSATPHAFGRTISYRVARSGSFHGRHFSEGGEVVVADRPPREGEVVVMLPRGRGCPRLGTMRGGRLFGAADEPCTEAWWVVAGPLVRVARPSHKAPRAQPLDLPLPLPLAA